MNSYQLEVWYMNIWSLLYFTSFLFYVFSGVFVLRLNRKSIVNIMFFCLCFTLSLWSLGYTFSTGARDAAEAMRWRGVSTMGWTYFYSTMLIFFVAITNTKWTKKNLPYSFLLYIPSTLFFLRFLNHDTGNYAQTPFGWIYVLYYKSLWSTAFDLFYLICVLSSFTLLWIWGKNSDSLREHKQVKLIISTMFGAFFCGAMTDTILPIFGLKVLPMGIIFSSIVVVGIWVAITKYKMMNLTQEIASENVLATMMDPVIIMNMEFVIGRVNKAATSLTGYVSGALIGESANRIVDILNGGNTWVPELLNRGYINGFDIDLATKSGKKIPCLCSGVCIKTDYGERIGVILVLHDITGRKMSEALIEKVNAQLKLKISKINNVFNNVGEGILTFNKDLKVQDEYSFECEKIFEQPIDGKSFSGLLFQDNTNMKDFMNSLLVRIFESREEIRELYLPLLPDEVVIKNKVLSIQYKFTTDEADEPIVMAILLDITAKKQLESKMEQERKILKMVVKTIQGREDFIELITEFNAFMGVDLTELLGNKECTLRQIHTLKGNFSQFYMIHLIDSLDCIEDKFHTNKAYNIAEADRIALKYQLSKDMQIIESYVGKVFFEEGERFTIDNEQLIKIENYLKTSLEEEALNKVLPLINNLRNKSLHELLGNYPTYTAELGDRWGKSIVPFEVTGDRVYVDARRFQDLAKSLVHIFRNCVAHGIETEDERAGSGKDLSGAIKCAVKDLQESIQISISDDGRGIDLKAVERKVLEEAILSETEWKNLLPDEKLQLIFRHGVSSEEKATTLSGRGVGLTAVKEAVDKCGGNLKVLSLFNQGTEFIITLPKICAKS